MKVSTTMQRAIFRVIAFLSLALVIPDLLAGSFENLSLPLAIAFGSLSYASAEDVHLFPIDSEKAAATPLSNGQRNYGIISVGFAVLGLLIWYINAT